jgi:hypothetical protein
VSEAPATEMKWYRSVAVKTFGIAFVATHVPLLVLIAVLTLRPQWLTPWGVFLVTLVATLLATALVLWVLWRLFRPLRLAADGLLGFMLRGETVHVSAAAQDEVGRLVRVLVRSLAHLGRSRAPLLHAGALLLNRRLHQPESADLATHQVLALVEVDQWQAIEDEADAQHILDVQAAFGRRVKEAFADSGLVLTWGRGRCLVLAPPPAADMHERLAMLRDPFHSATRPARYTCSAVVETRSSGPMGWSSALQRLEHRLFALRLGLEASAAA